MDVRERFWGKGGAGTYCREAGGGVLKGRGSAEKYCRAEGGGASGRGFEWRCCGGEVGGIRQGAVQGHTAERKEGVDVGGKGALRCDAVRKSEPRC